MPKTKPKEATFAALTVAFAFLALFGLLIPNAFAAGGTIAKVNYYPNDEATYRSVNYFRYEITAVNTNNTVLVSVDGKTPIPLIYHGTRSETIPGDTAPTEWYSWQTTVPAITAPGKHTFQFFSHYYVWQETDRYWAEFNAYSDIHTLIISSNQSDSSPPPDLISTTSVLPQISLISEGALIGILVSAIVAVVASVTLGPRSLAKRNQE